MGATGAWDYKHRQQVCCLFTGMRYILSHRRLSCCYYLWVDHFITGVQPRVGQLSCWLHVLQKELVPQNSTIKCLRLHFTRFYEFGPRLLQFWNSGRRWSLVRRIAAAVYASEFNGRNVGMHNLGLITLHLGFKVQLASVGSGLQEPKERNQLVLNKWNFNYRQWFHSTNIARACETLCISRLNLGVPGQAMSYGTRFSSNWSKGAKYIPIHECTGPKRFWNGRTRQRVP